MRKQGVYTSRIHAIGGAIVLVIIRNIYTEVVQTNDV